MLQCGRCKGFVYCSATCQQGDWSAHRKACSVQGGKGADRETPIKEPPTKLGGGPTRKQSTGAAVAGGAASKTPQTREKKRSEKVAQRRLALEEDLKELQDVRQGMLMMQEDTADIDDEIAIAVADLQDILEVSE